MTVWELPRVYHLRRYAPTVRPGHRNRPHILAWWAAPCVVSPRVISGVLLSLKRPLSFPYSLPRVCQRPGSLIP